LTTWKADIDKIAFYVSDCRSMGIVVLPPDVNNSEYDFTIEERDGDSPAIRFGLGAIKNVGQGPVDIILKERVKGAFKNLSDFARRVDLRLVGKRALESLIKVGALDSLGTRRALLEALDRLIGLSSGHHRMSQNGQMNLFGAATILMEEISLTKMPEGDPREVLVWEKELLGLYVSSHPLLPYWDLIKKTISHTSSDLEDAPHNLKIVVGGMVTRFRPHQTKTGKWMGFVGLEDLHGILDLTMFPSTWEKYSDLIGMDAIICVEGRIDKQNGDVKIIVDNVKAVEFPVVTEGDGSHLPSDQPAPADTSVSSAILPNAVVVASIDVPEVIGMSAPGDTGDNLLYDASPVDMDSMHTMGIPTVHETTSGYAQKLPSGPQPPAFILPPAEKIHLDGDHPHMLLITLRNSGDKRKDVLLMRCIHGILVSSPGRDRFAFQVFEGEHFYRLEFPNETTGISQTMLDKIQSMLGIENIRMEQIILH
jgi:DNA polymerase-3 subunit alpha